MKIALINENSQAAKNGIIEAALKKVVEPMGHEVVNYGMYAADDAAQLTYVQCGILAAERQHQHRTQHCPLKLRCGHAGEIDSRTQRFSGHLLHNFPRFRKSLSNGLYYTVYVGVTQT